MWHISIPYYKYEIRKLLQNKPNDMKSVEVDKVFHPLVVSTDN